MEKIDRLGWTAGFTFRTFGNDIGVRTNEPALLPRIREFLPPIYRKPRSLVATWIYSIRVAPPSFRPGVRNFSLLYDLSNLAGRSERLENVLEDFGDSLDLKIALISLGCIFVHCGVVGWKGRAILVPGASHSGKTSLIAEMVRRGATYFSDEYAVLDPSGRVRPYPRPLGVRNERGASTPVSPESLGGPTGQRSLPVGLVLLTDYHPGATLKPRAMTPGQAALSMIRHTIPARIRSADMLGYLRRALTDATVLQGVRGEAGPAADWLMRDSG